MTLTQLIDRLRDMQAKYGGNVPVYLGQASGCDLPADVVNRTFDAGIDKVTRVTIYPPSED